MSIVRALGDAGSDAARAIQQAAATTVGQAQTLASRGSDTALELSHEWRDRALDTSRSSLAYVRRHPLEAVAIAVAAGALTLAVMSLLRRRD